jgi:hypothetical protein
LRKSLLVFFFLLSSQASALEIQKGFYGQVLPFTGFGFTTTDPNAPGIPLELGVGYDINDYISIGGDLSFSLFFKPYDVASSAVIGRVSLYPFGRLTITPFIASGIGGGAIEDKRSDTKYNQLILTLDAGLMWFFSSNNALIFRLSDFYQMSNFVDGNINVVQAAFLLRHVF